ncbi:nickel pincer cofactor biosynthesis protein LarC2 [Salimicrobium flavidum]|uniref:TIGR00299 family protein n=1 Tax=Salimicrobium flavidum TaxID=570947 RepID=A0A1N7INA7_9BACI|nr:nickel insertion protein [Salimicrobium flavidum]SIS38565.1 hypothetical protein SAMN05421687_101625 [Salimicrobium flavidum]
MEMDNDHHIDEAMMKLEVNLDDTPGEWLGYVMEELFDYGANDVYYIPIYMKKNRPGVMLTVLCRKEKQEEMKRIILNETTTLGIRYYPLTVERHTRRYETVTTRFGAVTVKQGIKDGHVFQQSPEYEECRRIAKKEGIPLKSVYQEVWQAMNPYEGGNNNE